MGWHYPVLSIPWQPRKCWVILGDIFNGVKETRPSCILHLLISVMGADNHPRVSKLRIFEGVAYEVSAPSQLQGGPTGSLWFSEALVAVLRTFTICISPNHLWLLAVHMDMGFNCRRLLCVTQVTKAPWANAEELPMLLASQDQVHSRRWSRQCNSCYFCQCTQCSSARRTSRCTIGWNIVVHRSPTLISLVDEVPKIHVGFLPDQDSSIKARLQCHEMNIHTAASLHRGLGGQRSGLSWVFLS